MATAFVPNPNTWYILTFAHSGHVLGAKTFSHENGTPLGQTAYARMGHQQWSFVEIEPGWYQPIMRSSSGTKSFGRALQVWDLGEGSVKQQWAFEPLDGGGHRLRNRYENEIIEVEAGSPRVGASIVFAAPSGEDHQRVDIVALPQSEAFEPEPEAWYTIRFAHSGHVLDVESSRCTDGSAVVQAADFENHNQQWSFEEVEPGWYILHPRHCSKRVLEVPGSSLESSEKLAIRTRHGGHNQQWKVVPAGDGYQIRSRVSNGAIAIEGASIEPGARLIQQELTSWTAADNARQHRHVRIEQVCEPVVKLTPTALRTDALDRVLQLPLIRCFYGREVTLEAWVRPRQADSAGNEALIVLGENGTRFAVHRNDDRCIIRLMRDDRLHILCSHDGAFSPGKWTHVAVTVEHENKEDRYPIELYIDGVRKATGRTGDQSSKDGHHLFGSAVQSECAIGSEFDRTRIFQGELAEVRIWKRRLSSSDIANRRYVRLRGNESNLVACYRLDAIVDGRALDQGRSRLHAAVTGGEVVPAEGLPLSATVGAIAQVEASGKLYREWLPVETLTSSIRASLDLDVAWQGADEVGTPSVAQLGRVEGDIVELSLFEADLTLRNADAHEVGARLVKISLARDEVVIIDEPDGSSHAVVWSAGVRTARVDESGNLQLRFVARTSEGPRIYVRHEQMARDVWTAVELDVGIYAAMHEASASDLLAPASGRPSPLPANASQADADAVAQLVNALAWAGSPPPPPDPESGEISSRGLFNSVTNLVNQIGDAFEDTGSVVWKQTKNPSQLVGDVADLAMLAVHAVPSVGKNAIVRRIAEADQLGVTLDDIADGTMQVIHIVGQTAGEYWRVLVTELSEAAAALGAFFKRIGASIENFLEYLATLFGWNRFLKASDAIHDDVLESLAEIRTQIKSFGSLSAKLDPYLVPGPSSPSFDKSINDIVGELGKLPKLDELELVMKYARRICKSSKLKVSVPTPALPLDFGGLDIGAITRAFDDAIPAMMRSPTALFEAPIRPVYEMPAELWKTMRDVIDTVWNALLGIVDAVFDAIEGLLTQRITIPWLTRMIEDTILGTDGNTRDLSILRLFSLAAAIPYVLAGGEAADDEQDEQDEQDEAESGSESIGMRMPPPSPGGATTQSTDQEDTQEPEPVRTGGARYRSLSRASAGLGIANWVLWTVRAAVEADEQTSEDFGASLAILQSTVLGAAAGVELYRYGAAQSYRPEDQAYIQAACLLDIADALCTFGGACMEADEFKTWVEVVGSYGVGSGWIANAACNLGGSALDWEVSYWSSKWILDGIGKYLRQAKKNATNNASKTQFQRGAWATAGVSTSIHALYLYRASGGPLA